MNVAAQSRQLFGQILFGAFLKNRTQQLREGKSCGNCHQRQQNQECARQAKTERLEDADTANTPDESPHDRPAMCRTARAILRFVLAAPMPLPLPACPACSRCRGPYESF